MLHNTYAALGIKHGWSATARIGPSGSEGNIVFMHFFINSLSIQPCNPTLVMLGFKRINTDTTVQTSACCRRRSPAGT
jgi:hypothetical protein